MDDFSDITRPSILSSAVASRSVLTVSELNQAVSHLLETRFPLLWVSGEVSSFTSAASGHWYFTLKDNGSQIRAVMFRGRARLAEFKPKLGDRIEVRATLSMYMARGEFQLNVEAIRHAGAGNLYEAFLKMKARLEAEGLFARERKQPLPSFVQTVGVVTSPQAAALRDVMTTLARRAPHINIILYPAPVQGADAAEKIAEAIAVASERAECDALIVCRGGGSLEDLWSFNEEPVARAIAACQIPVISGVGHETDSTIADFVADVRAPTPTGAAEMVSESREDMLEQLEDIAIRMKRSVSRQLQNAMQHTDMLSRRLVSPASHIQRERLRLESLSVRHTRNFGQQMMASKHQLSQLAVRLSACQPDVQQPRQHLKNQTERLVAAMNSTLVGKRQETASLSSQLELLNPQRILDRGYAIMQDEQGRIIRSPSDIPVRKPVSVQLAEGGAEIVVSTVQPTLS